MEGNLLDRVLSAQPPPFALLHRPDTSGADSVDVFTGTVTTPGTLAGVDLPEEAVPAPEPRQDVLVIVPFRQIAERGFACVDDGAPLISMNITGQGKVTVADMLHRLPAGPIKLLGEHFDLTDAEYADTVRRIVTDEIGGGEGSNFVLRRSFVAEIENYQPSHALAFFRGLLQRETGAYWTFVIHTGTRTFVGASPERHLSLRDGTAVMNPISGTYRYPPSGPTLPGLMDFLADRKEADELYMVVDEELKMMARICDTGGRVIGPHLKEMARVAHTEYFIEGRSAGDPRDMLRETLFAPTVTGSPLESACRIVSKYEPAGRGYYGGIAALIGRDGRGARTMDSAILIRTADIDRTGAMEIGLGATLVRHSDPAAEADETRAKAAGLLTALGAGEPERFRGHPRVLAALAQRNTTIARFWLADGEPPVRPDPLLAGRQVLVIDAEDNFTCMLDHQLRSLGVHVTVRRFDQPYTLDGYDLVVLGPGPGDPRDTAHPKIAHLRQAVGTLLSRQRGFVAVCLSHQVLSLHLGFELARREIPNQGVQREIDLFGVRERVGFYNTFAARSGADTVHCRDVGAVRVSRDRQTGEVHALRGPRFASLQFHPESVLTQDGVRIVGTAMKEVLGR
jgi:phenazine biosynthesis protein phzE